MVGFKAAGAKLHCFNDLGGIKLIRSERVGYPAAVNQCCPESQQPSGDPWAKRLLRVPAGEKRPTRPSHALPQYTAAIHDISSRQTFEEMHVILGFVFQIGVLNENVISRGF